MKKALIIILGLFVYFSIGSPALAYIVTYEYIPNEVGSSTRGILQYDTNADLENNY